MISILLVFFLTFLSSTWAMQCNHTINGRFYDLSPLKGLILTSFSTPYSQYYLNLCGTIEGPCNNDTMICQVSNNVGTSLAYNIEMEPVWSETTNDGISLTFNNAPAPPSYSCYTPYITTIIDLQCDPTGMKQMKVSPAPCIHEIILPTVLVCPERTSNITSTSPSTTHPSDSTAGEISSIHSGAYFGIGISLGVFLTIILCGFISYHKRRQSRATPIVIERSNSEYVLQDEV